MEEHWRQSEMLENKITMHPRLQEASQKWTLELQMQTIQANFVRYILHAANFCTNENWTPN